MDQNTQQSQTQNPAPKSWDRPAFEVIALDCEITAYAPDGDFPLF